MITKINIQINQDFYLGIYNSSVFNPITSYVKNILGLEFSEHYYGDKFYIGFFMTIYLK